MPGSSRQCIQWTFKNLGCAGLSAATASGSQTSRLFLSCIANLAFFGVDPYHQGEWGRAPQPWTHTIRRSGENPQP